MWWFGIRKPVRRFAELMELRLRIYDKERGRQGWLHPMLHPAYIMSRADEELIEVQDALDRHATREDVVAECADVANFMMMMADVQLVRSSYERARSTIESDRKDK